MVFQKRHDSPNLEPERQHASFRIDFEDAGHPSAAAVSIAGDTMMQGCAFRPELCAIREFHQLRHSRRSGSVLTRLFDKHRL